MGGVCCKPEPDNDAADVLGGARVKAWKRPRWKSDEPLTTEQLQRMRDEYWDTQPHYGGDRVIWDALRAACAADLPTARIILDSAGVIVAAPDMSVCYDERGSKYELPRFVVADPSNLVPAGKGGSGAAAGGSGDGDGGGDGAAQLELPALAAGGDGAPQAVLMAQAVVR